jgi:transposase-like protein
MARKKYTQEFRVSAVKLVNEQGYTIPDAARSLGVDPNCVRGWVQKFGPEAGLAPSGDGALPGGAAAAAEGERAASRSRPAATSWR